MHEIHRARATKYNPFQREIRMQLRKKRPEEVVVLIGRWQRGAVEMICSPVAEEFDSGGACQSVSDNLFYFTMQLLWDCNSWNGRITDNLFYLTLLQKNEILNTKSDPSTCTYTAHISWAMPSLSSCNVWCSYFSYKCISPDLCIVFLQSGGSVFLAEYWQRAWLTGMKTHRSSAAMVGGRHREKIY